MHAPLGTLLLLVKLKYYFIVSLYKLVLLYYTVNCHTVNACLCPNTVKARW